MSSVVQVQKKNLNMKTQLLKRDCFQKEIMVAGPPP